MSQQIITSLAANIRSTCQSALIEFDWTFHPEICSARSNNEWREQWAVRGCDEVRWGEVRWGEVRLWCCCGLVSPGVWHWVLCVVSSTGLWSVCISLSQSQVSVCNWAVSSVSSGAAPDRPPLSTLPTSQSPHQSACPLLTNKLSLDISLRGARKSFIQTVNTNSVKVEMLSVTHITCINQLFVLFVLTSNFTITNNLN